MSALFWTLVSVGLLFVYAVMAAVAFAATQRMIWRRCGSHHLLCAGGRNYSSRPTGACNSSYAAGALWPLALPVALGFLLGQRVLSTEQRPSRKDRIAARVAEMEQELGL